MPRICSFFVAISCLLFFNWQCEDDYFPASTLEVFLENPSTTFSSGDTIWLTAEFMTGVNREMTITEQGGLAAVYVFAIDTSDNTLSPTNASRFTIDRGQPYTGSQQLDEAAHYFTYECPAENCTFRVGVIVDQPGLYLIKPEGLGFETTSLDPEFTAEAYSFQNTFIGNPPDYTTTFPWLDQQQFTYQTNAGFPLFYSPLYFDWPLLVKIQD